MKKMSNSALKSLQSATIKLRYLRSLTPTSDSPTTLHQNATNYCTPVKNENSLLKVLSSLSRQSGEHNVASPPSTPIKSPRMRLVNIRSKKSAATSDYCISTLLSPSVLPKNHVSSPPVIRSGHYHQKDGCCNNYNTQEVLIPSRHIKDRNTSPILSQSTHLSNENHYFVCASRGRSPNVGVSLSTSVEKRNYLQSCLHKREIPLCTAKKTLPFDTPVKNKLIDKGFEGVDVKPYVLGRGGFGTVVLANWKGRNVAVKIIKKHCKRRRSIEISIKNEENAIEMNHPNVVQTLGIHGSDQPHTIVIMEFAGCRHLGSIIEDTTENIAWNRRLNFALQIASALQWCHRKRIVHLDIKPANVIVSDMDVCKLCDFGCSKNIDRIHDDEEWHLLGGTIAYRAPELLRGNLPTIKADIYSFAFILWQLLTRENPFAGWESHVLVYKVVACDARPLSPRAIDPITANYVNLYKQLWVRDAISRPDVDFAIKTLTRIYSKLSLKP